MLDITDGAGMDSDKSGQTANPHNRAAPRPLSVYMGAVMAMLQPGATDADVAAHQRAVERMLAGIKKYQSSDYTRVMNGLAPVWAAGSSILYHCPAVAGGDGRAVMIVPSMINGPEILDLYPGRSFVRWLAERGFDVYLLDWGTPSQDAGLQDMDGVLARVTMAADYVRGITGRAVDALGYCMGGTLALGAAARGPDVFGRLMVLSAPWDFHAGDARMRSQVMTGAASALQLLESQSVLPVDWIQTVFAHVNPRLALDKFSSFLDMPAGSAEAEIFVAVEDWLNGGQDLSAGVARTCILDWYGHNTPGTGKWVDLAVLENHPVLVVAAQKDILVPPESAIAATHQLGRATIMRPDCGHISLMAGRRAVSDVWEPLAAWLSAR